MSMTLARRASAPLVALMLVTPLAGCQMFENMMYELQPHRLRRLNSGPGMSSDAYYSVADPIASDVESEQDRGVPAHP
jgi:hypothetical protein